MSNLSYKKWSNPNTHLINFWQNRDPTSCTIFLDKLAIASLWVKSLTDTIEGRGQSFDSCREVPSITVGKAWQDQVVGGSVHIIEDQEAGSKAGNHDLLALPKLYVPNVPQPLKTVPSAEQSVVKHEPVKDISISYLKCLNKNFWFLLLLAYINVISPRSDNYFAPCASLDIECPSICKCLLCM